MKLLHLLFLLLFSVVANADFNDSPYEKFSTNGNFTTKSKITWEVVDDVQAACNNLRIKNGHKPYTYKVLACSTWTKTFFKQDECKIITSKTTSTWTIGHELRHCFQGEYHK